MDGIKRCKCANCHQPFRADPRNAWHQRYCQADACRAASKAASQQRWLAKPENRDYFRGADNVARVRAWREAHPGYARRAGRPQRPAQAPAASPAASAPLQEIVPTQVLDPQEESRQPGVPAGVVAQQALQDLLQQQPVVLIGLLAHLSDSTLQDGMPLAACHLLCRSGNYAARSLAETYYARNLPASRAA
jgi:hypothetical protein